MKTIILWALISTACSATQASTQAQFESAVIDLGFGDSYCNVSTQQDSAICSTINPTVYCIDQTDDHGINVIYCSVN